MLRASIKAGVASLSILATLSLSPVVLAQSSFSDMAAAEAQFSSAPDDGVLDLGFNALYGGGRTALDAISALESRGNPDVAAHLILAMRYNRRLTEIIDLTLRTVTGSAPPEGESGWFGWMLWQEANPQIVPHPSFTQLKQRSFANIDPAFMRFVGRDALAAATPKIRLEEIAWGGVIVDGIPALDNPALIPGRSDAADYLHDDDLVFGVEINGDARAYPLRIMGWHEMFNDVVGGVPVSLAYCTLCGAGILYDTMIAGQPEPFTFGSSGFLYRSNKLMYDRQTDTLWNQFTGEPVIGPLTDSGIVLPIRPVATTDWKSWLEKHPDTKVLALQTGYRRNYGSGVVYRDYFASPDLMFPAVVDETVLRQKDRVFGIRTVGAARAWPIEAFRDSPVIEDRLGALNLVLIGDAETRTVRAYDRSTVDFTGLVRNGRLSDSTGGLWTIGEESLMSADGSQTLPRVPGHLAYWFAWQNYLGLESTLYGE